MNWLLPLVSGGTDRRQNHHAGGPRVSIANFQTPYPAAINHDRSASRVGDQMAALKRKSPKKGPKTFAFHLRYRGLLSLSSNPSSPQGEREPHAQRRNASIV
jgi:hypothetical protein